jgi:hypothetical protein
MRINTFLLFKNQMGEIETQSRCDHVISLAKKLSSKGSQMFFPARYVIQVNESVWFIYRYGYWFYSLKTSL